MSAPNMGTTLPVDDFAGLDFAAEARAMHDGEAPERSIYGEARLDEARALVEGALQRLAEADGLEY